MCVWGCVGALDLVPAVFLAGFFCKWFAIAFFLGLREWLAQGLLALERSKTHLTPIQFLT